MKRKLKLSFTLLSLALFLGGCAGSGSDVTTITEPVEISFSWWGNDARHQYTIKAIERFEALHPDIVVNCNYTEWSGYQTRSNVQMRSRTEADVMQINYAWIAQYSPDGDGYYDLNLVSDQLDMSTFGEYELSYGMQNGKLNAMPIAMNTQSVYINKTVYDKYGLAIPKTWEDIFSAAKVMKGEVYPISMNSKSSFFYITAYAEQVSGKQFMDLSGNLNFTAKEFQTMLEFYCRLVNENAMPQVEYFERTEIDSGHYAGVVAWLSDGSSYCDKAVANGYEVVVADYPASAGAKAGDGWYAKPATMYAISKNTSHPREAAILLDFLLNSKEMAELQGIEKGIPLSTAARDTLAEQDAMNGMQYQAFLKMNEFSDNISVVSPYYENDSLIDEFRNACNEVLYERSTAEEQGKALYRIFKNALK